MGMIEVVVAVVWVLCRVGGGGAWVLFFRVVWCLVISCVFGACLSPWL